MVLLSQKLDYCLQLDILFKLHKINSSKKLQKESLQINKLCYVIETKCSCFFHSI